MGKDPVCWMMSFCDLSTVQSNQVSERTLEASESGIRPTEGKVLLEGLWVSVR